ncbi:MAG TPA: hypothetical protein VH062_00315 [Polyangiaceae bacterium]|jgi:hypothetical protein|nr:hypothetical protein [Polyangiaceae bacterium]
MNDVGDEQLTVEEAAARIREERIRAAILRDVMATIESYFENREAGVAAKLVRLDEGAFPPPRRIVDAVRADIIQLITAARERREALRRRKVL